MLIILLETLNIKWGQNKRDTSFSSRDTVTMDAERRLFPNDIFSPTFIGEPGSRPPGDPATRGSQRA